MRCLIDVAGKGQYLWSKEYQELRPCKNRLLCFEKIAYDRNVFKAYYPIYVFTVAFLDNTTYDYRVTAFDHQSSRYGFS